MAAPAAAAPAAPAGEAAPGEAPAGGEQQAVVAPEVQAMMDGVKETLEQQRQLIESRLPEPQQQEAPPAEEPTLDMSFLDPTQPTFDAASLGQQLQSLITDAATQQAKALVAPVQEAQQRMQLEQETNDLLMRHPELGDDAVAQKTLDTSKTLAEQLGHPELATKPAFWGFVYQASRATDLASAQQAGAAGPGRGALEGGGGASPGVAGQGDQPTAQQIAAGWTGGPNRLPLFSGKR